MKKANTDSGGRVWDCLFHTEQQHANAKPPATAGAFCTEAPGDEHVTIGGGNRRGDAEAEEAQGSPAIMGPRLKRIGQFSTVLQAKKGKANPAQQFRL